jgi:hypothetical protein
MTSVTIVVDTEDLKAPTTMGQSTGILWFSLPQRYSSTLIMFHQPEDALVWLRQTLNEVEVMLDANQRATNQA